MSVVTVLEPRFHIEIGEVELVSFREGPAVREILWTFARAAFDSDRADRLAVELAGEHEHVRIVDREADGDLRRKRVADAVREFLPAADESAMFEELEGSEVAFDGRIHLEQLAAVVLGVVDRGEW